MITIQAYKDSNDSIMILLDDTGIEELIGYLSNIRKEGGSMHLNIDNELSFNDEIADNMIIIPHVKIVNLDKIDY